jgi:hypothetical protein
MIKELKMRRKPKNDVPEERNLRHAVYFLPSQSSPLADGTELPKKNIKKKKN